MAAWTPEFEAELTSFLKDWLKQQGRTQADLRRSLRAISTRMPAILDVLKRDHQRDGLAGLATRLCAVESEWHNGEEPSAITDASGDPFSQLDVLLQEIRQDCPD